MHINFEWPVKQGANLELLYATIKNEELKWYLWKEQNIYELKDKNKHNLKKQFYFLM